MLKTDIALKAPREYIYTCPASNEAVQLPDKLLWITKNLHSNKKMYSAVVSKLAWGNCSPAQREELAIMHAPGERGTHDTAAASFVTI